jgi:hypothetical protein
MKQSLYIKELIRETEILHQSVGSSSQDSVKSSSFQLRRTSSVPGIQHHQAQAPALLKRQVVSSKLNEGWGVFQEPEENRSNLSHQSVRMRMMNKLETAVKPPAAKLRNEGPSRKSSSAPLIIHMTKQFQLATNAKTTCSLLMKKAARSA